MDVRDNNPQLETCYFTVLGMTCASCVDNIQRNLSKHEGSQQLKEFLFSSNSFLHIGIHSVLVALLASRAEVKYDPAFLLPSQIATLINDLGFQAEVLESAARGTETIDINV